MADDFNPYAAPTTITMHPRAAEWLRSTSDPSLLKVANGLGMMYTGIIALILSIILGMLVVLILTAVAGGAGLVIGGILVGLALLAAVIMMIVGKFMCLSTPEETGAKNLILASIVLDVVAFIISLTGFFTESAALGPLGNLVTFAAQVTFLLFLRQLSEFIGAVQLVERARLLLTLLGVTIAVNFLGFIGAFVVIPLLGLLLLVGAVISIVSFFLYLGLLDRLRKAIQSGGAVYV
jgi:hypothetical protein